MSTAMDLVNAMYRHSQWSNKHVLHAAEHLPLDQLHQPVPGAYGSILENLVHMMGAQMAWTRRFQQLEPVQPPEASNYAGIPELRLAWAGIDAATDAYIASLDDEGLNEIIRFRSWFGWEGESPRWQAILHQALHQHQHRGEVALALTALGCSPGELDIFDYLEEHPVP